MQFKMKLGFLSLLIALVLLGMSSVLGDEGADNEAALQSAYGQFWQWRLENNPEFASNIGDHRYDDGLEDYTPAYIEERRLQLEKLKETVDGLSTTGLNWTSVITYDILKDMIQTWLDGHRWKFYGPMNPISFLDGIQTNYGSRAGILKFQTSDDVNNFITRIRGYARRVDATITRMRTAIYHGTTHHEISMAKVPGQLGDILKYRNNVTYFDFYVPFGTNLDVIVTDQAERGIIRQNATEAIGYFMNQIEKLKKFIEEEYHPNTRTQPGVLVLPDGKEYYRACLRWHLSMDVDPEDVHNDGLKEVEKVFKKMTKIVRDQGHTGSVKDYFNSLRNRTEFFIQDKEQILQRMRDILNDRIQPALATYFYDPPEFPMEIKAMTYDGPNGIYKNGAADGSRPGVFYANVFQPEYNPTYVMPALLLHETDPGHHMQDAFALTSTQIPDFMKSVDFSKYFAAPLHFPFYTAYSEGWGLYSEDLGEDLGIYKDDFEMLGKYNMEIFRAARMVVDTGLHYYGWSKERAVQYMLDYTTSSRGSIEREIDRYATWPGQATSYTVGKLKILKLRRHAESLLGPKCFDIKEFHHRLLAYGAMPLSTMEKVVNRWIADVNWEHKQMGTSCRDDDTSDAAAFRPSLMAAVALGIAMIALR